MSERDDPLAGMRGILNGLMLSLVLWCLILVALAELIRWVR